MKKLTKKQIKAELKLQRICSVCGKPFELTGPQKLRLENGLPILGKSCGACFYKARDAHQDMYKTNPEPVREMRFGSASHGHTGLTEGGK